MIQNYSILYISHYIIPLFTYLFIFMLKLMYVPSPMFPRVNPSSTASIAASSTFIREPDAGGGRSQQLQKFRVHRLHTAPSLRLNSHSLEQPMPTYARSSTAPTRRRQFVLTRGERSLTASSLLNGSESSGANIERSLTGATLERSYTYDSFLTARTGASFGLGPLERSYTGTTLEVLRETENGSGPYIGDSDTDPDLTQYRVTFENTDQSQQPPVHRETRTYPTPEGISHPTGAPANEHQSSTGDTSGTGRRKRTRDTSKKPDPLIERLFSKGFGAFADVPPRDPNAPPPRPEMPTFEEPDANADPRTLTERLIVQSQTSTCKWVDRLRKWLVKVSISNCFNMYLRVKKKFFIVFNSLRVFRINLDISFGLFLLLESKQVEFSPHCSITTHTSKRI